MLKAFVFIRCNNGGDKGMNSEDFYELLAKMSKYLPFTFQLKQEDSTWFVSVKELPGCMSDGRDPNEAILNVRDAIQVYMESFLRVGNPLAKLRKIIELLDD